jgi:ABC-2 type transport system permease protein
VESVQAASFVWIFPLTFASSAFVPISTMPGWLQAWAKVNPISIWTNTLRTLVLGSGPQVQALTGGSLTKLAAESLLWIAGILAVFVPLSIRIYRKRA